jgi:hypothetical protein
MAAMKEMNGSLYRDSQTMRAKIEGKLEAASYGSASDEQFDDLINEHVYSVVEEAAETLALWVNFYQSVNGVGDQGLTASQLVPALPTILAQKAVELVAR